MINALLLKSLPEQAPSQETDVYFDTAFELYRLATNQVASHEGAALVSFLSTRIEISGRLFSAYGRDGRKTVDRVLDSDWCEVALGVLYVDFLRLIEQSDQAPHAFKRLNAIFKLIDFTHRQRALDPALLEAIEARAAVFFANHAAADLSDAVEPAMSCEDSQKTLPITVLFWEGPIARAYLATLKSMGYRPEKIVHLISSIDLVSKKVVGRFLPGFMRQGYAQSRQQNSIHYWSSVLLKKEPPLCQAIRSSVSDALSFDSQTLDEALALTDLSHYCSVVEPLMITGLGDEKLHTYLAALPQTTLLFTGGGIVPARLLHLEQLKFIHVHPGHLPDVRGADCVLWSQLLKGRTSATCFYMAPGIDDGDVILARYLPTTSVGFCASALPSKMIYRAVYAFLDPWVRAWTLRQAIVATEGLQSVAAVPQDDRSSVTFHFMHEKIQKFSLANVFIG